MEKYLVDYKLLSKIIDALIAQKYTHKPSEGRQALKAKSIKELDNRIGDAIFGKLTDSQAKELSELLDRGDTTPDLFQNFFERVGLNIEQVASEVIANYSQEFLGGSDND